MLCFIQRDSSRAQTAGPAKVFEVKSEYGTLAFRGKVERTEAGDKYKFRIQIIAAFLPGETLNGHTMTNRTKIADLTVCDLVASIVPPERQPVQVLYRESYPIAIRLTEYGQLGKLPDLEFSVAKSVAERATHIGLGVSDGRLYWPIPTELKQ